MSLKGSSTSSIEGLAPSLKRKQKNYQVTPQRSSFLWSTFSILHTLSRTREAAAEPSTHCDAYLTTFATTKTLASTTHLCDAPIPPTGDQIGRVTAHFFWSRWWCRRTSQAQARRPSAWSGTAGSSPRPCLRRAVTRARISWPGSSLQFRWFLREGRESWQLFQVLRHGSRVWLSAFEPRQIAACCWGKKQ